MPIYEDPYKELSTYMEIAVLCFLVAGTGLCLGVGFVLSFTMTPYEDLAETLFWPALGVVGFASPLFYFWATRPPKTHG